MGKMFGTDGIRGEANSYVTPELAFKLGRASAYVLTRKAGHKPKMVVGTDTRVSADMLEAAFTAGACSVGADTYAAGIIPTPALPILIKKRGFDAGLVVSASHNTFEDNGLKLFDGNGYKLPDSVEDEIEDLMLNEEEFNKLPRPIGTDVGRRIIYEEACDDYIAKLKSTIEKRDLGGIKVALDCANGATYRAAPLVFYELGASAAVINNWPDGRNINLNCGSTSVERLVEFVKETRSDVGIAFDGDGDRLIAVDERGNIVDGDMIMSICANYLKANGKLAKNTVVSTVMSNLGFFKMCQKFDLNVVQTKLGDRYVLEEMLANGYNFGGEQSGHVIFSDYNTTGDGIITALQLIQIMRQTKKSLSELNTFMTRFPQVLLNVKTSNENKSRYNEFDDVRRAIEDAEKQMLGNGRVLIRPSGTEAKVRVMIEGEDLESITRLAENIAHLIEKHCKP